VHEYSCARGTTFDDASDDAAGGFETTL